jgi:hypothetical protein
LKLAKSFVFLRFGNADSPHPILPTRAVVTFSGFPSNTTAQPTTPFLFKPSEWFSEENVDIWMRSTGFLGWLEIQRLENRPLMVTTQSG